jgi:hypothetical protein
VYFFPSSPSPFYDSFMIYPHDLYFSVFHAQTIVYFVNIRVCMYSFILSQRLTLYVPQCSILHVTIYFCVLFRPLYLIKLFHCTLSNSSRGRGPLDIIYHFNPRSLVIPLHLLLDRCMYLPSRPCTHKRRACMVGI